MRAPGSPPPRSFHRHHHQSHLLHARRVPEGAGILRRGLRLRARSDALRPGRTEEAVVKLRQREGIIWRLGKLYLTPCGPRSRANARKVCKLATNCLSATPKEFNILRRQLSFLREPERALETLSRSINHGFFCYPAMVRAPGLDGIRTRPEFTALLRRPTTFSAKAPPSSPAAATPSWASTRRPSRSRFLFCRLTPYSSAYPVDQFWEALVPLRRLFLQARPAGARASPSFRASARVRG